MTSPSKKYIGIDPGKSGGITVIRRGYIKTRKCPDNVDDMSILFSLMANDRPCEVIVGIEKVWSFPTDSSNRAFTFGVNFGHWLGIIASHDIQPILVTPQKWMSHFDIPKGLQKTERKNIIKQKAKDMYPKLKGITLATSDSILIAKYMQQTS